MKHHDMEIIREEQRNDMALAHYDNARSRILTLTLAGLAALACFIAGYSLAPAPDPRLIQMQDHLKSCVQVWRQTQDPETGWDLCNSIEWILLQP